MEKGKEEGKKIRGNKGETIISGKNLFKSLQPPPPPSTHTHSQHATCVGDDIFFFTLTTQYLQSFRGAYNRKPLFFSSVSDIKTGNHLGTGISI